MNNQGKLSLGRHRYAPFIDREPTSDPNGQTIALFHGISMPHTHWGELPAELGDLGYRTVAIGLAENDNRPHIPSLGRYATDAAKVMEGVIGQPAHLLGLSWGGLLVQQIALDHPDRVDRVVAAATIPATPLPLELPDFRAALAIASPFRSANMLGDIYGGDFRNKPDLAKQYAPIMERHIDAALHARQQIALWWSSSTAWRRVIQKAAGMKHPETTFLYGDDDPIIPRRQVEAGAKLLGAKAICIADGGHGFLITRPRESAKLIHGVLSESK